MQKETRIMKWLFLPSVPIEVRKIVGKEKKQGGNQCQLYQYNNYLKSDSFDDNSILY